MKLIIAILFSFSVLLSFGQRYNTHVFDSLQVDSMVYAKLDTGDLWLDLIQPANDNTKSKRPLVIFIHGGSFKAGYRNKEDVFNYCKKWAHYGYVVATISYRLTLKGKSFHCDQTNEVKINTFKEASLDLHKATKFFLNNSEKFNIDTKKIILAGNSAGGEAILHAAHFNKSDLIQPILPIDFKYAGLLSYSGAIIDTSLIKKTNTIPTALFHGTCDQWVPYGKDFHHYCHENTPGALLLYGSKPIMTRLKNLDTSYYMHTICGMDHIVNKTALIYQFDLAAKFIYKSIILNEKTQQHLVDRSQSKNCKYDKGVKECLNE